MIKVIRKDNEITVIGHAGYAEYGKDIVCCAVTVMEDFMKSLLKKLNINFSSDESSGYFKIKTDDDFGIMILDVFYENLKDLSEDYSNYIKMED